MKTQYFIDTKKLDSFVLGGVVILLSLIHIIPFHLQPVVNLCSFLLTLFAWLKKQRFNFQLGLISTIGLLHWFFFYPIWPLPLLLGIALTGGLYFIYRDQRFSYSWLKRGEFNLRLLLLGVIFILVSSASLLLWFLLLKPDLSDLNVFIPPWPLAILIGGGFAFSVANAFAEEFIFRGILFQALSQHLRIPIAVIIIQAATFACLHMDGFPRGITGVILAFIYGLMMGVLRQKSQGFLLPWIIHIFADMTIVFILLAYLS